MILEATLEDSRAAQAVVVGGLELAALFAAGLDIDTDTGVAAAAVDDVVVEPGADIVVAAAVAAAVVAAGVVVAALVAGGAVDTAVGMSRQMAVFGQT